MLDDTEQRINAIKLELLKLRVNAPKSGTSRVSQVSQPILKPRSELELERSTTQDPRSSTSRSRDSASRSSTSSSHGYQKPHSRQKSSKKIFCYQCQKISNSDPKKSILACVDCGSDFVQLRSGIYDEPSLKWENLDERKYIDLFS